MRKLDRGAVRIPAKWEEKAKRAFPDHTAFEAKARLFEALDLADPTRRAGFKRYAPDVLPKTKAGKCEFKAIWGSLKKALKVMSHQKCAYCESPLTAELLEIIEHFKPKSLFPLLVYDCNNYFVVCGGCNGAKLDQWPASGSYVRPDEGDPEALFAFHSDGRVEGTGSAAGETIAAFGLDRGKLREVRSQLIEDALSNLKAAAEEDLPLEVQERLARRTLARVSAPPHFYSVAISQCVLRFWGAEFPSRPL